MKQCLTDPDDDSTLDVDELRKLFLTLACVRAPGTGRSVDRSSLDA